MRRISRNVFFLGVVSFLSDLSSDMVMPVVLPLFMRSQLGPAALPIIGLVEGLGDSAASLLRLLSGWLSDVFRKRKAIVIVGYSVSTLVKPVFALAGAWWHFLTLRFAERTGKGIRTAPRDALLAASVSPETRGISFGLQRAMDTAGAFCGVLSALILVWALSLEPKSFRPLFLISFFPGLLAVIVLALFVSEKAPAAPAEKGKGVSRFAFSRAFYYYLTVAGIFALGNSSDAFLVLRAKDLLTDVGRSATQATLLPFCLLLAMNAVDASLATWVGSLSDRIGRRSILVASFGIYALVYFGLAFADREWMLWVLFAVYGLYYATSHGLMKAIVADFVPDEGRGSAFGLFHMVTGIVALPASLIMGALYYKVGAAWAFSFGASLALVAAVLLLFMPRSRAAS
jgi:MFS family permease